MPSAQSRENDKTGMSMARCIRDYKINGILLDNFVAIPYYSCVQVQL
jgi:hypothetical protein